MSASKIAEHLEKHKESILEDWVRRVRADLDVPETDRLSEARLRDHLPLILDELTETLRRQREPEQAGREVGESTATHGHARQRFEDNYDLRSALRELAVLRVVVIDRCDAEGVSFDRDSAVTFHAAIDQIMATSALELERLRLVALREKSAALEAEADLRERFMGILSHDLRSPLQTVQLGGEALAETAVDEEARKMARRIVDNAGRMRRMIEQLLDFTQMRFAAMPISRARIRLEDVAREAIDSLRIAHPDRPLELVVEGRTDGEFDADRLTQVFTNLVRNAIEHGSKASAVRVTVRGTLSCVIVSVHNRGTPIPVSMIDAVFEPFRRDQKSGGIGLGLHIVREIARAHGGDVKVVSTATEGTTFVVELPRST
jgi:signal transduction histidine kinase